MGRSIGNGIKEMFRRGNGTVKSITVQVNERNHRAVLGLKCYESVCGLESKGCVSVQKRPGERRKRKENQRKEWTNYKKESIL